MDSCYGDGYEIMWGDSGVSPGTKKGDGKNEFSFFSQPLFVYSLKQLPSIDMAGDCVY